jgi:hypothetical protein
MVSTQLEFLTSKENSQNTKMQSWTQEYEVKQERNWLPLWTVFTDNITFDYIRVKLSYEAAYFDNNDGAQSWQLAVWRIHGDKGILPRRGSAFA